MADQHHGALELVQRHGQRLARGQIEVVGGLVQQQQVGALPHDHGQHQARLLAAAELAHGLQHHLAGKTEGAEEVAQLLLAGFLSVVTPGLARQPHHVLQRRAASVQHVQLLLREIADRQALALGDLPAQQRQRACHRLHESRFALAVGAQDADALACHHGARHAAQDHAVARLRLGRQLAACCQLRVQRGSGGVVAQLGFQAKLACSARLLGARSFCFCSFLGAVTEHRIAHGQHRVGQVGRLLELELEFGIGQHRRDAFHALQRLHAALRLLGLGRLGLEAVDELLQVGDLLLLLGIGRLLQRELLRAQLLEGAVVAAVARQLLVLDVQGDARHRIQKLAVVADHDQRAGVALQPAFQPHQRVQVQVVGGFIQQQQIAGGHQRARQLQAHAPAAREAVHRLLQLIDLEAQPQDQRLGARARIVRAGVVQVAVCVRDGDAVARLLCFRELLAQVHQALIARKHEFGRRLGGLRHVLRHLRDAPGGRHGEVAAVLVQRAVEQREQRRLARAIAPHQRGFLAGVDGDAGAVEQHLGATAEGEVLKLNHGRESNAPARGVNASDRWPRRHSSTFMPWPDAPARADRCWSAARCRPARCVRRSCGCWRWGGRVR